MLSVSFMRRARRASSRRRCCPRTPTLENYRELFAQRAAWAATSSTACSSRPRATLCSLFFNALAGYAFAKLRFAGRERLFRSCSARS